ncbi:hypothetical protein HYV56_00705 [Candidatus Peregrinibacteria bacterium]|nr:hypothetical protein [Candidatus Peregrinibacteria bacterium]
MLRSEISGDCDDEAPLWDDKTYEAYLTALEILKKRNPSLVRRELEALTPDKLRNLVHPNAPEKLIELLREQVRKSADVFHALDDYSLGRLTEDRNVALALYNHAAQEGDTDAINRLGEFLLEQIKIREAFEMFLKAVHLGSIEALNKVATIAYIEGNIEKAIIYYERVLQRREAKKSLKGTAHHGLAACWARLGELTEAKYHCEKAIKYGSVLSYILLGTICLEEGNSEAATVYFEQAEKEGLKGEVYWTLGSIAYDQGDIENALSYLSASVQAGYEPAGQKVLEVLERIPREQLYEA